IRDLYVTGVQTCALPIFAFIPMKAMGLNANLMSLAGIAISIGVLVDGAIVEVENAYNKLHLWNAGGRKGDFHKVRLEALLEVGRSEEHTSELQSRRDLVC